MTAREKGPALGNGGPLAAATPEPAPQTRPTLTGRSRGPGITVAITSIPPRRGLLSRAFVTVLRQELPAAAIAVAVDLEKQGAPATRDRALSMVGTDLVAFLDDDDELGSGHLGQLAACMAETGADLVYPWFSVVGGHDPFPQFYGKPWDDNDPHQVPVTFLARTELIRDLGGFAYEWDPSQGADPGVDPDGNRAGEDYRLILRAVKARAKIVHHPARTWLWHHDSGNTMGLPGRW